MKKTIFYKNLIQASQRSILWAQEHVIQSLSGEAKYLLFPCQSYDGNPLEDDEQIFPGDALPEGEYLGPYDEENAIDFLWRRGKIPEWIDISVHSEDDNFTYLQLLCCGRFTALEKHLYHIQEGHPPFHVTSPPIPTGWESVEENGKFDLYWRTK